MENCWKGMTRKLLTTATAAGIPGVARAQGVTAYQPEFYVTLNVAFGSLFLLGLVLTIFSNLGFIMAWRRNDDARMAAIGKLLFFGWLLGMGLFALSALGPFAVQFIASSAPVGFLPFTSALLLIGFMLVGNIKFLIAWLQRDERRMAAAGKVMVVTSFLPAPLLMVFYINLMMGFPP